MIVKEEMMKSKEELLELYAREEDPDSVFVEVLADIRDQLNKLYVLLEEGYIAIHQINSNCRTRGEEGETE